MKNILLITLFFFTNFIIGQNLLLDINSNTKITKLKLSENMTFTLKKGESVLEKNNMTLVYRADGPKNYKSYNKRIDNMDLDNLLIEFHNYITNHNFVITHKSKNYNDIEEFFNIFEKTLLTAKNEHWELKLTPIKHNLNYSLFLELTQKQQE